MKLIILDRDGVINFDSPDYIKTPDEWVPIPDSLLAMARLNQLGYKIIIATNQSGIGRGLYTEAALLTIHNKLHQACAKVNAKIDNIYFCPHKPDDQCACRKPKPGMLMQISEDYQINLSTVPFVGDKLSDVLAAKAAGAMPVFIGQNNLEGYPSFPSLASYVDSLV